MKVRWTDKALDNLQNIHDYIAQDSRFYALRMIDRLTSRWLVPKLCLGT